MVDLKGQYNRIASEIDDAIQEVIESSAFINGPIVERFTSNLSQYLGSVYVVPCGNGTDALQIALMALDLQPGDEVIVPAFTYVATAEVIALLGLKPIMVDVDPDTFNLTVEMVEAALTPRTKCIVPVNLFGQCAHLEPIMQLAEAQNLFVIEDNAQSIGADYIFTDGKRKKSGTVAHIGTFSFYPSKNLGAYGDGGAICTSDEALAARIKMIANHGQSKKYVHDIIGCNSRLDAVQAAILDVKLKHLDDYASARQKAADRYDLDLIDVEELDIPVRNTYSTHVFHQYTLKVRSGQRDQLKEYLKSKGIPTMIYYPIPLYQQKAFKSMTSVDHLPVTEQLCQEVLSLPIHTEMSLEDTQYISETIKIFDWE